MQAFHNKQELKNKYIQRMEEHINADELIHGIGFNNSKGCAIGCTLNGYKHADFEIELGIPEWLAIVEDFLFENMSLEKSKRFPLIFLQSIKLGVDLNKIKIPFTVFILKSNLSYFDNEKFAGLNNLIHKIIYLYHTIGCPDKSSAWSAVISAAESVEMSIEMSVDSCAEKAFWSAESAIISNENITTSTGFCMVRSVASARMSARFAIRNASSNVYDIYADKLIELIKDCK